MGPGLLEIKLPATFIGKVPLVENYKHLEIINEQFYLKRISTYITKILKDAVTRRQYCDLFVFFVFVSCLLLLLFKFVTRERTSTTQIYDTQSSSKTEE